MGHLPLTRLWRWTQASVSVGELVVWLVMVIVLPDQSLGAAYVGRIVGGVCGKRLDRSPAKSSPSDRNGDGICHICMIIRPSSDPLDLVPRREHADRQPVSLLANDLANLVLRPVVILRGGLCGVPPANELEHQKQHYTT
jgi:hypothetical protein